MNNSLPEIRSELIPHLVCDPCSEAIAFYEKAFGAKETFRLPAEDGKRIMHAEMKIGDASIYLVDDFPEYCDGKSQSPKTLGGSSVTIHRQVPDCDAAITDDRGAGWSKAVRARAAHTRTHTHTHSPFFPPAGAEADTRA